MSPRNAFWEEYLGLPIDPANAHSSFFFSVISTTMIYMARGEDHPSKSQLS
jgi:hypothetical protein